MVLSLDMKRDPNDLYRWRVRSNSVMTKVEADKEARRLSKYDIDSVVVRTQAIAKMTVTRQPVEFDFES